VDAGAGATWECVGGAKLMGAPGATDERATPVAEVDGSWPEGGLAGTDERSPPVAQPQPATPIAHNVAQTTAIN
jgi:hypothetical protein